MSLKLPLLQSPTLFADQPANGAAVLQATVLRIPPVNPTIAAHIRWGAASNLTFQDPATTSPVGQDFNTQRDPTPKRTPAQQTWSALYRETEVKRTIVLRSANPARSDLFYDQRSLSKLRVKVNKTLQYEFRFLHRPDYDGTLRVNVHIPGPP